MVARTAVPERDMSAQNDHFIFRNVCEVLLQPLVLPIIEPAGKLLGAPAFGFFAVQDVVHADDVDIAAFMKATAPVYKLYTDKFGDASIKAIQAIQ